MTNELLISFLVLAVLCTFFGLREKRKEQRSGFLKRADVNTNVSDVGNLFQSISGAVKGVNDSTALLKEKKRYSDKDAKHKDDQVTIQFFKALQIKEKFHLALGVGAKLTTFIVVFLFSMGFATGLDPSTLDFKTGLILIGVSLVFAILAPEYFMSVYLRYKGMEIEEEAPDVIDLLMLGVEAGMSFDQSVEVAQKHINSYAPEIGKQLKILSAELVMLPDRKQALENLVIRTNSETFRYLKIALVQGEHYGTPIAHSLKVVASENRERLLAEKEEKARRIPVFLSIPLMLLILPPVIVISAGPGFISMMRVLGGAQ